MTDRAHVLAIHGSASVCNGRLRTVGQYGGRTACGSVLKRKGVLKH